MLKLDRFIALKRLKSGFQFIDRPKFINGRFNCTGKPEVKLLTTFLAVRNSQIRLCLSAVKLFHTSSEIYAKKKRSEEENDEIMSLTYYEEFEKWEKKNKKTFLETVRMYNKLAKNRAGHVDFIMAALKNMKSHGVHRDLECYKKILDVLPKGVYIIKNRWMLAAVYYPRQQYVVMDLLNQMGDNGVFPDAEMGFMLINIFGSKSYAYQKFQHMLYWSLKWKNKSPFILPKTLPSDPILLAKLAIERITSVDPQTEVSVYEANTLKDSIDKTWIVSGQSPKQKNLLKKHSPQIPVIVEEGNLVWLNDKRIHYFILKADGKPLPFTYREVKNDISNLKSKYFNPNYLITEEEEIPTVHEQDDGIIYGVCATGTSSKDSLLSWVRILENSGNSTLAEVPILFRFNEKEKLPSPFSEALAQQGDKLN